MKPSLLRNALVLGLLTSCGPFAVDMYLPALPAIGRAFSADPDAVVLSLTAFFLPFGLMQIVFGTLSDYVGRRRPLFFGLGVFVLAGIGCALATDISTLIAFRALQGAGAAAAIIVPRAIVRDMHSGLEEARLMSLLMLVFSVAPLLAPTVGSFITIAGGWRAVFWILAGFGVLGLALTAFALKETRPPELRTGASIGKLLSDFRTLVGDFRFVRLALMGGFGIGSFFVYLSNSSFVLMETYHFTPLQFSLAFSINAAAFFAAAQCNGWLGRRFGLRAMVLPAVAGHAAAMSAMALLHAAGVQNLFVLEAFLFVGYGFLGLFLPLTSVLALERYGHIAGAAASLLGTTQLMTGASIIAISGLFADGTLLTMLAGIAGCSVMTFALAFSLFGAARPRPAPAE